MIHRQSEEKLRQLATHFKAGADFDSGINIQPVPFYLERAVPRLVPYDLRSDEVQHLGALLHGQAGMLVPILRAGDIDVGHHIAAAEFIVKRKNRFRTFVVDVSATAVAAVPDFPAADALEARPDTSDKTQNGSSNKWMEGGHF